MQIKEFKLIEDANQLLNKQNSELGVKPMKIEKISKSIEQLTKKEENKTQESTQSKNDKSKNIVNTKILFQCFIVLTVLAAIILSTVILYRNYKSKKIENLLEKVHHSTPILDSGLENNNKDKPALITSGVFATKEQAQKAQKELSKLTGDTLRVIKINDYYSIRIGPKYKNYQNALLVFTELQNYPISDLSIKTKANKKKK